MGNNIFQTGEILYIIIFILLIYALYIGKGKIVKRNKIILYGVVPLFICFGYMIGADWRMYEKEFYDITQKLEMKEPSYYVFAQFFKSLGIGFWEFSIFYKLIGYYIFLYVYKVYSDGNIWGLIYWFPNYALFLWMDHPARNFIAFLIFSLALFYIEKEKVWKFLFLSLLASSFHATCLAVIPVYFIMKYTPNNKYSIWLFSLIAIYVLVEGLRVYMMPFLEILNIAQRMSGYALQEEYNAKMSILRFVIFFVFLLLATRNIRKMRAEFVHADFILKLSFLYVIYFCIGNIHNIFFRLQYFLMIPVCALISYLCASISSYRIRMLFRIFIILFSFIYMENLLVRNSHYVPYSNYLKYIFINKPSYNYRDSYNPSHSPYSAGD